MRTAFQNIVIAISTGLFSLSAFAQTVSSAQSSSSSAQPRPIPRAPSLANAIEVAQNAVTLCAAKGFKVAVSVVDTDGRVKALLVADGLSTMLGDFATRKALTSAFFKLPTSTIEQQKKTDESLAAKLAAEPNKFFTFAGGVPMFVKNELVGAIGVGGASDSREDEKCAMEAIAMMQGILQGNH